MGKSSQRNTLHDVNKFLSTHHGFSEEEFDFIINHDFIFRIGKEWKDN